MTLESLRNTTAARRSCLSAILLALPLPATDAATDAATGAATGAPTLSELASADYHGVAI